MNNQKYEEKLAAAPKVRKSSIVIIIGLLLLVLVSMATTKMPEPQSQASIDAAHNVITGILHPSADKLFSLKIDGVPYLILETMAIAFLGTILGSIFAIVPAILGASNYNSRLQVQLVRLLLNIIRTVPPIIYGLMFIRVTGPGPFAGVMTFSLTSIGMVAKLYIEALEELDGGILEALDSVGASYWQKVSMGIMPQIQPNFISTAIYRYEINVKDAAVLGLVSAGGLGTEIILAQSEGRWNDLGAYIFGLVILVFAVEHISTRIRTSLVSGN